MSDDHQTEFLVTGRGGGKTHACLIWAKRLIDSGELPSRPVIAVHSDHEKTRLRQMWVERYGDDPANMPRFYTYAECRNGSLSGVGTKVALDNLDIYLQHTFPYPVDLVTTSGKLL